MKKTVFKLSGFVLLCSLCLQAQAGLLINPKRILLDDDGRAAALDLLNDSNSTSRYQIYFEQKKMLKDGSIVDVNPDENIGIQSKDMVRYSPRRVTIEPGLRQTVRLAVRRPKDLAEGEYVSHLVFQEIPEPATVKAKSSEANDKDEDEDLSVSLKPTLKIAIPIIIREGELASNAELSDLKYLPEEGPNGALSLSIMRDGSASLYGSVEVFEVAGSNAGDRVGLARGVGVYTSVNQRALLVRLNRPVADGVEALLVRFDEDEKYGGTSLIEKTLRISQ